MYVLSFETRAKIACSSPRCTSREMICLFEEGTNRFFYPHRSSRNGSTTGSTSKWPKIATAGDTLIGRLITEDTSTSRTVNKVTFALTFLTEIYPRSLDFTFPTV